MYILRSISEIRDIPSNFTDSSAFMDVRTLTIADLETPVSHGALLTPHRPTHITATCVVEVPTPDDGFGMVPMLEWRTNAGAPIAILPLPRVEHYTRLKQLPPSELSWTPIRLPGADVLLISLWRAASVTNVTTDNAQAAGGPMINIFTDPNGRPISTATQTTPNNNVLFTHEVPRRLNRAPGGRIYASKLTSFEVLLGRPTVTRIG